MESGYVTAERCGIVLILRQFPLTDAHYLAMLQKEEKDDAQKYENHGSLYFFDGNTILLAPLAPLSWMVFRVHQSLLSRHSSVFRDMFLNVEALENRDGVPSVIVPDSAKEMECLLRYIYGDLTLPLRRLTPENLSTTTHLLKLSAKYAIPHIRKQLVPRLEQDWPSTLFRWDALEVEIEGLKNVWQDDPMPSYFDDYLPEPASAIRLGFECNIPSILPAAFYHLSRLTIFQDLRAPKEHPENLSHKKLSSRTADWNHLVTSDFISLMKGQLRLSLAVEEMVLDEPRLYSLTKGHVLDGCSVDEQWDFWNEVKSSWKNTHDVLQLLNDYVQNVQSRTNICYTCRLDIQHALKHTRQELWSRLPEYFSLA